MSNQILIIVGMHRSGTSVTSKWLERCGLNIGEKLMCSDQFNKDGHFEDSEFIDLHEEIFGEHDIEYGGFANIENFSPNPKDVDRIKELIDKKNEQKDDWGFKDPRTCLFLDAYKSLLPNAKYLVVLRGHSFVLRSLIKRDIIGVEQSIKESNRLVSLRMFKYNLFGRKMLTRRQRKKYTKAIKVYYYRIIEFLDSIDNEDFVCFRIEDLASKYEYIHSEINKLGFNLKNVNISDVFKPSYMSSGKSQIIDSELQVLESEILRRVSY